VSRTKIGIAIAALLVLVIAESPFAQRRVQSDPVARLTASDLEAGKRLFQAHCAHCHGIDGTGGRGPSLAQSKLKRAPDNKTLFSIIREGLDGKEMPGFWQMSDRELWRVAGYVRSLGTVRKEILTGNALRGKELFETKGGCTACHIAGGKGSSLAPELTDIGSRRNAAYLREALIAPAAATPEGFLVVRVTTRDGRRVSGQRVNEDSFTIQVRDQKNELHSFRKSQLTELKKEFGESPMPSYEKLLSAAEIDDLVAYLASLRSDAAPVGTPEIRSSIVPFDRIVKAENEPQNWLTYSGNYRAHRFSALDQMTPSNIGRLGPAWIYQIQGRGRFESSPIVVNGVMYVTEPPTKVTALDARTGRLLWQWQQPISKDVVMLGFGPTNRGVAILNDTVYVGTLDCHLVALDSRSGAVRWSVEVASNKTGHSITCAPLAIAGKVIVGVSGGEAGIRGFLDAYDSETGKRLWRLWTVPGPGEPGHETWNGDSWKTGGAPTWVTGSYDPELNLIYWGTGNPGPDWNGDVRPGDNLYSCSLLAVDASTGKLRWHFQFTPHDTHDWDATEIPVLIDAEIGGRPRKLVAMANRNAFYYLLDRATGEFILGVPYSKQTWAKGLDSKGRPIVLPNTEPSVEGTLVWPSLQGATNWFSPSYSPATKFVYVAVREMSAYYHKGEAQYRPGSGFIGGGERALSGDKSSGWIRALEATTGKVQWEFPLHSPPWSGMLSTAGGLVFGGSDEGNFYALDAKTGTPLWEFQTGGPIAANPISFAVDGHQYVAIPAGQALFVFGLPRE
jgi:alcohol dehydrogenase (cytochrome c)